MFVNTKGKSPSPMARFKNYLVWLDVIRMLIIRCRKVGKPVYEKQVTGIGLPGASSVTCRQFFSFKLRQCPFCTSAGHIHIT